MQRHSHGKILENRIARPNDTLITSVWDRRNGMGWDGSDRMETGWESKIQQSCLGYVVTSVTELYCVHDMSPSETRGVVGIMGIKQ